MIEWVAHRGYMARYPENCWRGLEAALEAGARWVEFDIQMVTPGRFILLHDADFKRTAGTDCRVFGLSEQALHALSVHEPDRFGSTYAPEPVASLEIVLERLAHFPNARAMVEIKEESIDYWGLEAVMQPLVKLLLPFAAQCVLISFSLAALTYTKRHSELEIGWVLRHYDSSSLELAHQLQPAFLICNHTKLPADQPVAAGTWQWMLYDITEPALARAWRSRGVQLIETGDIGRMISHPDP